MPKMNYKTKKRLLIFLDVISAVGIIVILFLVLQLFIKSDQRDAQSKVDQDNFILKMEADHDTQLKYMQCLANLFGSKPGAVITQKEFDSCLAGTRIEPSADNGNSEPVVLTPGQTEAVNKQQAKSASTPSKPSKGGQPKPNSKPAEPVPIQTGLLNCKIDILGLHFGC